MTQICRICPRQCRLSPGQTGFCRARQGSEEGIVCSSYGLLTALALDPIEKKPLRRFHPGSLILSAGSYGCNLRCGHCQNHSISMTDASRAKTVYYSPQVLVEKALSAVPQGNIGIAYTYNEPLIGFEYVLDCARLAREKGLKNVLVTNGYVNPEPLSELLPFIDAMNIDLKSFTDSFYEEIGGSLRPVLDSILLAHAGCHVEVTTLVIPGKNDSMEEMEAISGWLSMAGSGIPLHISRFFPCYQLSGLAPTPVDKVYKLAQAARRNLKYVYTGNC